jgi:hypothetical protein
MGHTESFLMGQWIIDVIADLRTFAVERATTAGKIG